MSGLDFSLEVGEQVLEFVEEGLVGIDIFRFGGDLG